MSTTGAIVSSITTSCVCVVKFPVESVNVQVIVVDSVIGRAVSLTPLITPSSQLSVAVGAVNSVISH